MKILTAMVVLILSISAFASSDTKTFRYDGSEDSVSLNLKAEKTHTEYRYEQQHTICYREEVVYRTICSNTPQGRICRTVPHYRTISYPCIRTIRVPYEVHDYFTEANVNLSVSKLPEAVTSGENFRVTLDGDDLRLSAVGSKKYFIVLKKQSVRSQMMGSLKMIDADYAAELVEAAPVVKALDVKNISLKDSILSFKMGPVEARDLVGFSLQVKKSPILGSDTVLFDRELTSNEIMLSSEAAGSAADVNIEKLGIELASGRYTLTSKIFFKYEGSVLNASQFDRLDSSRTLVYKIR